MPKKRIFTEEEKQIIIDMNNRRYSYVQIGKAIHCSYETLAKFMKENGIEKTKSSLKNHSIIEDYFSIIDTEEKAYFLGLLKTDGFIRDRKGSQVVGITLKRDDEYMVQAFRDALKSDVEIIKDNRPGKECSSVEITNQKLCDDLAKFDIVPDKTYLLKDIKVNDIPSHLQRHYLRGLLDGDGGVFMDEAQVRIMFCAYHESFVESFQKAIDEAIGRETHNNIRKYNAYQCNWKGNQLCKKILTYLYEDSTIFLRRKKEFYDFLKDK